MSVNIPANSQDALESTDTLGRAILELLTNFSIPAIVFYLAVNSSEPWSPTSFASFFPESLTFFAYVLWLGCCCDLWFFILRSFSSIFNYLSNASSGFIEIMFSAMDGSGGGIGGGFAKILGPLFALLLVTMAITLLQAATVEAFGEENVRFWTNIILLIGLAIAVLYPVVKFIGIIKRIVSLVHSRQTKTA